MRLNAAGSGGFRVGFVQRHRTSSDMLVTYRDIERVEVYTLGGADRVLSDDTARRAPSSTSAAATTSSSSAPSR